MRISTAAVYIIVINLVSLGAAMLSCKFFETRFLRLKDRFKPRYQEREAAALVTSS